MPKEYILGMDIGGTNFRMGLVDHDFHPGNLTVYPSRTIYEGGDTVSRFARCIQDYLQQYQGEDRILAVSIGCPSVVDAKRRRLLSSTNFPGLDGIDLVEALEKELKCPVFLDHDACYLLAFDLYQQGVLNEGTVIGCYFGTGLGNAMFINGKPYIGKNGTACELGHLPVALNEFPCSCGNRGCIEMFSCGKALERLREEYFTEVPIGELFERCGRHKILRDFVEYMAVAVASEINIMDPHCVFLGGGVVQMKGFPRDYFTERIKSHCRKPFPAENIVLKFSRQGAENGIVGAAIRAFELLKQK